MKKYSENKHYEEPSIDLSTGEQIEEVKTDLRPLYDQIIKWADNEQGSNLFKEDRLSQYSALKRIRLAGHQPSIIKQRFKELKDGRFKDKNLNFHIVRSDLATNPPK
jgi:hypothetical protein